MKSMLIGIEGTPTKEELREIADVVETVEELHYKPHNFKVNGDYGDYVFVFEDGTLTVVVE